MVSNQKATGRASSLAGGLAVGVLCAMVATIAGSAIFARLVSREMLQESSLGYISAAILVMSSGIGAWVAAGRIKKQRMVVCLLSALCYFLVLLSCTALFFGGQYEGIGVTALTVLGTGCAVGLLGLRETKGSRRHSTGKMHKSAFRRR